MASIQPIRVSDGVIVANDNSAPPPIHVRAHIEASRV
jgi:hypothetical protein